MPGIALSANLTNIVVEAIVPDEPTVIGDVFVPTVVNVLDVDTSSPTGGVIVMPVCILVPDTVNDLDVEAVP